MAMTSGKCRINTVMGIEKKFLLRVDVHKGGSMMKNVSFSLLQMIKVVFAMRALLR